MDGTGDHVDITVSPSYHRLTARHDPGAQSATRWRMDRPVPGSERDLEPSQAARSSRPALLQLQGVSRSFGGLRAVSRVDLEAQGRRDPRPDRAERGRQDHAVQPDHRRCSGRPRAASSSGASTSRGCRPPSAASSGSRGPSSSCARSRTSPCWTTSPSGGIYGRERGRLAAAGRGRGARRARRWSGLADRPRAAGQAA